MEEDSGYNKVESVIGCHVEDAVTFWAQHIDSHDVLLKTSLALAEICPQACPVFGNPDLTKIYGGCFSEDKCWYRCKILQVINDEKCQVLYIDYGNSEILNRAEIVEIPAGLQHPSVAKKYRLWGLQIPVNQDINHFEQGKKFLNSLTFEKEVKARCKTTHKDGTIVVQAQCDILDIGEEVAKRGFAEKFKLPINCNVTETKMEPALYQARNGKAITPARSNRVNPASNRVKGIFGDNLPLNKRNENNSPFTNREKMASFDFNRLCSISLEKINDQKIIEENEKLMEEKEVFKEENRNLLRQCEEWKSKVEKLNCDLEEKTKAYNATLTCFEGTLQTYIGTTVRSLAAKFEQLKETRQAHRKDHFGEDLSEALYVVTEGCLAAPPSLEKLQKTSIDYNTAQEKIRLCTLVDEVQSLIVQRNEVRQEFYSVVEEFIVEVDDLPLAERLETLQKLQDSLKAVYGQTCEAESSDEVVDKFFEWKSTKLEEFRCVRSATDDSLERLLECFSRIITFFDITSGIILKPVDVVGNLDEVLRNVQLDISKELDLSLIELGETEKIIILNVYSEVMQKIQQEVSLLNTVHRKYLDSIEFKNQVVEWMHTSFNTDDLLLIKKTLKHLKAQLRWKMVEKNNLEESDEYNESEMAKIKEEITGLRNSVFQEIYEEQEEYEKLSYLVQNWFPELPVLHPEAGILKYMNSAGLLTGGLERDILDAQPMKELSTKRPLVSSEVQGQRVLLKGYSVDLKTETGVIERAAKYHKAWKQSKEESGLMQLMFLFLCKSDPLAYLMVPYYDGASLGMLQTTTPLTPEETLKVMKGVARGLHTLHRAGIVHGSLHENNVFAVNREQGIVGDFDFTKSVDQRVSMNLGALNGLSLMCPEVKEGQPPSPASDMYAYGCLFVWLFVENQEFEIKEDKTPQMDDLNMDDKVKSLLVRLLCCNDRLTAEQVLAADCFLLPDVIPVLPDDETTEFPNGDKTPTDFGGFDEQENETDPSMENRGGVQI